jgi:Tfp pilus assembly protein PilN
MLNINFVPEDYIQKRESMRANVMYLVLFLLVMAALGGAFTVLKMRQRAINTQSMIISSKMEQAKTEIAELEELQSKRKEMMKAALTTAELLEPMPRTVILAELTNSLPPGVSLRCVKLAERKVQQTQPKAANTYDQAKAGGAQPAAPLPDKIETGIEIEGMAPSDIQVAGYIAQLNNSILLDEVQLVQSKENSTKDGITFREFKLKADIKDGIRLTQKDIDTIRAKRQQSML